MMAESSSAALKLEELRFLRPFPPQLCKTQFKRRCLFSHISQDQHECRCLWAFKHFFQSVCQTSSLFDVLHEKFAKSTFWYFYFYYVYLLELKYLNMLKYSLLFWEVIIMPIKRAASTVSKYKTGLLTSSCVHGNHSNTAAQEVVLRGRKTSSPCHNKLNELLINYYTKLLWSSIHSALFIWV